MKKQWVMTQSIDLIPAQNKRTIIRYVCFLRDTVSFYISYSLMIRMSDLTLVLTSKDRSHLGMS